MHASLPLVSGKAHLLRWAVLCKKPHDAPAHHGTLTV
jgi:hypothetical protein